MSNLKPLKEFTPEMNAKINSKLMPCTYGRCGNGLYFWDFETMKQYSPFDDSLEMEEERDMLVSKDGKLYAWPFGPDLEDSVQQSYQEYIVRLTEQELLED